MLDGAPTIRITSPDDFAAVMIVASLLVVGQRNPMYSVLLLIVSFGALSGLYVLLGALGVGHSFPLALLFLSASAGAAVLPDRKSVV